MAKKSKKAKNCTRGYSCGYSCIATSKSCINTLQGQGKSYAKWLKNKVESGQLDSLSAKHKSSALGIPERHSDYYPPPPRDLTDEEKELASLFWYDERESFDDKVRRARDLHPSLTKNEAKALAKWVSDDYAEMAKAFYDPGAVRFSPDDPKWESREGVEFMEPVNRLVNQALHKLPPITKTAVRYAHHEHEDRTIGYQMPHADLSRLRRGLTVDDPETFIQKYRDALKNNDGEIREDSYMATTFHDIDQFEIFVGNLEISIKPKVDGTGQGRYVDNIKNDTNEGEILYPAYSRFRVTNIQEPQPKPESIRNLESQFNENDVAEVLDIIWGGIDDSTNRRNITQSELNIASAELVRIFGSTRPFTRSIAPLLTVEMLQYNPKLSNTYTVELEEI